MPNPWLSNVFFADLDETRVVGEAEIIVGAEIQDFFIAVFGIAGIDDRGLRRIDQNARIHRSGGVYFGQRFAGGINQGGRHCVPVCCTISSILEYQRMMSNERRRL